MTLKPWQLRTPHAFFWFEGEHKAILDEFLEKIPGLKQERNGSWRVPENALALVEDLRKAAQCRVVKAVWGIPKKKAWKWEEVEAELLKKGEARPEFLGGWLKSYQKAGIALAWSLHGVHLWFATGCLSGDAVLKINRAGKTFDIQLKDLLTKFHGKGWPACPQGWRQDIPTRAQSNIDGFVRLNDIIEVYESGVKEVFQVDAAGFSLKATEDHRFATPDGYRRLSDLKVGDLVLVRGGQKHVWEAVVPAAITRIESKGMEQTYDISMKDPHNNFIANGFVVHNSGKTPAGIFSSLEEAGPVVVITKASVRLQYAREIERFTTCKAHVVRPEGQMSPRVTVKGISWFTFCALKKQEGVKGIRAAWEAFKAEHGVDRRMDLKGYLDWCKEVKQRPFVVIAWENIRDRWKELEKIGIGTLILDEAHTSRNSKRWEPVPLRELPEDPTEAERLSREEEREAKSKGGFIKETENGRVMFLPVESMASAAANLARCSKKVIATTATPVANRVRDLWSQLDLVEPNAWGNATKWQDRHCNRKPGVYGGFDTTGQSNIKELEKRMAAVSILVSKAEMQRDLPGVRRVPFYIDQEDLDKPSKGFKEELEQVRGRGPSAVLEVRLAEAASQKRRAVIEEIESYINGGQKVAVFTARRRDCDLMGDTLRKNPIVKMRGAKVWSAHGDYSTETRQAFVDEFMQETGPAVFVGTGHAFGTGVNLDSADAVFFVMLPYTPEQIIQWEGRFCIEAGQWVPTTEGAKKIEDIVVGDFVFTHAGRARKVLATFRRRPVDSDQLYEIHYDGQKLPLRLTGDHAVWAESKEGLAWTKVKDLAPGDYLTVPRIRTSSRTPKLRFPDRLRSGVLYNKRTGEKHHGQNARYKPMPEEVTVSTEVAWLFGHFVGDGWTRVEADGGKVFGIAGDSRKKHHLDRVVKVLEGWGLNPQFIPATKGKGLNVVARSSDLALWFRELCGADSHTKRVPQFIFDAPTKTIESFLDGYFDADGSEREGRQEWATVSDALAHQLPLLLAAVGRFTSLSPRIQTYPYYLARPGTPAYAKKGTTLSYWGLCASTKTPKRKERKRRKDGDFLYRLIKKVEPVNTSASLHDLTVEEDESFVVGQVAVHNCRASSTKPVIYYYCIAEGTVDEHIASILIDKLPMVQKLMQDNEVGETRDALSGIDRSMSDDDFAQSVLDSIDRS